MSTSLALWHLIIELINNYLFFLIFDVIQLFSSLKKIDNFIDYKINKKDSYCNPFFYSKRALFNLTF